IDGVGILVGLILQCAKVPPAFNPVGAQRDGAGVVADGLVGVAGVPGGIGGLLQGLERVAGVLRECCRAETQRQSAKGGGAAGPERGHTKTFSLGRWFEPVGWKCGSLRFASPPVTRRRACRGPRFAPVGMTRDKGFLVLFWQ